MAPIVRGILAPNPGPMTLEGTNSYVVAAPGAAGVVVVDPGPLDEEHLSALTAAPVELILLTHHHVDHTEASVDLAARTGAPVRARDFAFCIDAEPLLDGEEIDAAGTRIRVIATPGHTADSLCFEIPDAAAMLTGDTILGRGTTAILHPDGALGPYLHSLERLRGFGAVRVLPGHGPELPDLAATCDEYLRHRLQRLDEVRSALVDLGEDASAAAVTAAVYPETSGALRAAAEASVRAQLEFLRAAG